MKELTEELKKDIGLKLFEFFYSYTREGDDKFDAKYPDYKKSFYLSLPAPSPILKLRFLYLHPMRKVPLYLVKVSVNPPRF